jgi:hypothetical protein
MSQTSVHSTRVLLWLGNSGSQKRAQTRVAAASSEAIAARSGLNERYVREVRNYTE